MNSDFFKCKSIQFHDLFNPVESNALVRQYIFVSEITMQRMHSSAVHTILVYITFDIYDMIVLIWKQKLTLYRIYVYMLLIGANGPLKAHNLITEIHYERCLPLSSCNFNIKWIWFNIIYTIYHWKIIYTKKYSKTIYNRTIANYYKLE